MNAEIDVRVATDRDAAGLAGMLHDFNTEFGDPSPGTAVLTRRVSAFLGSGKMVYLLGGRGPDGFAQVLFRPTVWADSPIGAIEELYVKPDLRRQGIGAAMMKAIFRLGRGRGAAGLELTTGEDDLGARALYEKTGFRNEIEGKDNARCLFYELKF